MDTSELKILVSTILSLFISASILYFLKKKHTTNKKKQCSAPQARGAWPIIGHLHLFGSHQLTHRTLGAMAEEHGPIFTIKLGSYKVLVLSSCEMVKECFTIHDKAFSTRPCVAASKLMGYDCAMFGFTPYGPYWREIRKLTTLQLLSNHRLELLKKTRETEKAMRECVRLFGVFVLSDAIPSLGWLDFNGHEKAMKKTASEMDTLVKGWLDEHKRKRASNKEEQDFMDVMLNTLQNAHIFGYSADTIIKATCLNLILAGSDATMVTLTWALSLLLNNKTELKRVQEEINIHIGNERKVEESDISKLEYLQAVVKETLRLYPPSPIITFRAAMEDCTFSCGYHIPAGTHLMVNAWKIHRDGDVWEDPQDFKPQRFLTTHKHVDVRGQNFELVPFSSGRRACPGASLALRVVHLTLARLLQSFEIDSPSDEAVDMTESFGLTNLKATPLQVLLTPRLHPKLYEL
ncbi:hypothetical protein Ahy_Scaffold1g106869 isoform H [Arachis hypogaea]|uniref:Cytochrome P450 n=1 Tax=Arachis hypogaea TaxID=3818 RepID=A0A444WST8_ARAHY|nr:hypothetical protein Ahy_Scaffold1g106869 isoform H [Arachis hypogaea]